MIPMEFGEILIMLFWEGHNKCDFPLTPSPPPPPHAATMDTFYSSPMHNSFGKHYLTVLLLELEKSPEFT